MVEQMDLAGFGDCTWYGECQAACPKEISINTIVQMDLAYTRAILTGHDTEEAEQQPRRALATSINQLSQRRHPDFESALGGADAVEKTTYVVGDGTSPNARAARPPAGRPARARQSAAVGDRADRCARRAGLRARHRAVA